MFFQKRIVLHLIFWFAALLFLGWFYTQLTQEYSHTLVLVTIVWPVSVGAVYFINLKLIPNFLFRERYKRFTLYTSYTLIIATWITLLFVYLYFFRLLTNTGGRGFPFEIDLAFIIAGMFLVIFAGVLIHVVRENFRIFKEKTELEKLKLTIQARLKTVEAKTLKAQFHPHFLFNTLNNLYSLSLKKSDDAPKMILKLSDLLDHSLNRTEEIEVRLEEEVSFIKNYIDLAAMRFGERMNISFCTEIENPDHPICPNILIPFVENAIKHGISPEKDVNKIKLILNQKGKEMYFEIENAIHKSPEYCYNDDKNNGLGIQQVQAFLAALYSSSHKLHIEENENIFKVKLRIYGGVTDPE